MFELPQLPYNFNELEPAISSEIMELHYTKHHKTYVDNLNKAIESSPELKDRPLNELLLGLDSIPESVRQAIRNNGGGHYNHSLFWQVMSPSGDGEPGGELASKLNDRYGSFQGFVDEFTAQALGIFGSGWAWLMPDVSIITTPNQDTPIMQGLPAPLLGLDVWEHAYYLDYKNVRADYIKAWWDIVNWEFVQSNFQPRA